MLLRRAPWGALLLLLLSGCPAGRREPERSLLPGLAAARFVDSSLAPEELRRRLGELEPDRESWALDEGREAVLLRRPGTLVVPLRLAGPERELRFDLHGRRSRGRLRLAMLDASGERRDLGVVAAPAAEARVRLGELTAGLHFLLLTAELEGGSLSVVRPRLLSALAPHARVAEAVPGPGGRRPHLVILVLDAARADHLGCYGYERATTPHIDALAKQGLIFRRAFAECPSTACSMPGLLTGTPFLADGDPGRRLADEVTTLAEALGESGYFTVGLSANPNNSIGRGLAQGFARFEQMWRGASGNDRRDPHRQTRRALELLAERPAGQPVLLVVHYVPPHEPYLPPPRFDLFTDPSYRGPVNGSRRVSRAMRAGRLQLDADDVAQMMALYDGNLRFADDAVGALLGGLEEQGLLEDAVVLVTADHGEAFFEHGVHGHNSTMFDEMLHVPFVLRLPTAVRPPAVDTDRLVSLLDVAPTFLALAGASTPSWTPGFDLLSPEQAETARDRVLFHLNLGDLLAARTSSFKAITRQRGGQRELYHLAADPGELTDVLAERPELYRGLIGLLAAHLDVVRRSSVAGGAVEVDAEDQKMLEALGYL